jgi:hypothetical protein
MPAGQRAIHWATSREASISGVLCVATIYEARSTQDGAIMANAGFDNISGGNVAGDVFISKYKRLTTDWTHVGGSSCSAATLRATPPPME